jgi:tRNA (guanine-N7-)-methyltransferase
MHSQRRIRSFVLRAGRTTAAQERALTELWSTYGIDPSEGVGPSEGIDPSERVRPSERVGPSEELLDLATVFGRDAPRCLEIGFGAGEVIGSLAENNPDIDYLGIEVHRSGVGRLLLRAEQSNLKNLRVVCSDAVDVLRQCIADRSFDEVLVFFPDPWHKKRHHKRRLIEPQFVSLIAAKLRPGGILRLATDWQAYAEQMLAVCNANPALRSLSKDLAYVPRPEFRPPTRFERRGERLGHGVWDLAYSREEAAANAVDDELHGQRGQNDAG